MLSVSNGFQVLGRTATVFSVDDIGFRYKGIPEEYIVFGEITGDDEKLCFQEKTGELVTIKEALIKSGVHDAQSDFSSDCIKTTQAYCRMSRSFCAGWRKICKQNVRQVEDVI